VKSPEYLIQDNQTTPGLEADSPFGGFVDLQAALGSAPNDLGDDLSGNFPSIGCAMDFYGTSLGDAATMGFSSNGLFFPRGTTVSGGNSASPFSTTIPSVITPNGFIAAFWDDLVASDVGAVVTPSGYLAANVGTCPNRAFIVQIINAYRFKDHTQVINYELQQDGTTPEDYWVLYDTVSGTLTTGSVGVEDPSGTHGTTYNGPITTGLVLHYYRPQLSPPPITVTFQVTVNSSGPAIITNTLQYSVDVSDTGVMTVSGAPLVVLGPSLVATVLVTATPNTLLANGVSTATVTATVLAANGTPVPGVTVNMSANIGAISPTSGTSNMDGQVLAIYTAPVTVSVSSTATIEATADGITGTAMVTLTQGTSSFDFVSQSVLTETSSVVRRNDVITYTFMVTNAGLGDANNVLIAAPIPSGTQYVEGSVVGGVPFSGSLAALVAGSSQQPSSPGAVQTIFWSGNIAANGSHTLSYAVQVTALEGVITNTARVYVDNAPADNGGFTVTATVTATAQALMWYLPLVQH
jgi:uncharacterized repeat protein (TIGR01451 family)